ncbi:MAG TPA: Rrf2 family transcriptional regulator [Kofleriaceae bacterium]|nr:Rrf2 family transcriptional regulator [Kofleriaceae bacterium]
MKRDARLSVALHALLHMEDADAPLTSEQLARGGGNAAAIRRTMAGLREAQIVRSEKGHGGGWTLARPAAQISLGEVYEALGAPTVFALGNHHESPGCLVEQAVNRALGDAFERAAALLLDRFRAVSLADLAADVRRQWPAGMRHAASVAHTRAPRRARSSS